MKTFEILRYPCLSYIDQSRSMLVERRPLFHLVKLRLSFHLLFRQLPPQTDAQKTSVVYVACEVSAIHGKDGCTHGQRVGFPATNLSELSEARIDSARACSFTIFRNNNMLQKAPRVLTFSVIRYSRVLDCCLDVLHVCVIVCHIVAKPLSDKDVT
jgi:hypothetical protein